MEIIFGFKSHSRKSDPELIYMGRDKGERDKALKRAAKQGFVRAESLRHPRGNRVRIPGETPVAPTPEPAPVESQPEAVEQPAAPVSAPAPAAQPSRARR